MRRVRAFILDLDGVLTDTARTHRRAWKRMFDELLEAKRGEDARPFTDADYRRYVDGRPRYDGAGSFLASRGIELPFGDPDDPPDRETVCGLGNRKNEYYHELLEEEGVERIDASVDWVRHAWERGLPFAVVTSSRNGRHVLEAAGIDHLFAARVDGRDGQELGLPGKPDPAYFVEAADRLGVAPSDAAVVEDAASGVEAGVRGGFGWVVGIAGEEGEEERLRAAGADLVVASLAMLPRPDADRRPQSVGELPLLLDDPGALQELLAGPTPALFLDYDGTLSPSVDDPAEAHLPEPTREALLRARDRYPLAIISGRDLDDLRDFVGIDGLYYAGSHGMHIREPDGSEHELKGSGGREVVELRPDPDWDKGSALRWILELLERAEGRLRPVYVGDDVTDEDAFNALPPRGLALVLRGEADERETGASLALSGPDQVRELITTIARQLEMEDQRA